VDNLKRGALIQDKGGGRHDMQLPAKMGVFSLEAGFPTHDSIQVARPSSVRGEIATHIISQGDAGKHGNDEVDLTQGAVPLAVFGLRVVHAAGYSASPVPTSHKAFARCKINDLRHILHSTFHATLQLPQNKRLVDLASFADRQECHAPLWKFLPVFAVGFALPFASCAFA
jgi:hypothetical protein